MQSAFNMKKRKHEPEGSSRDTDNAKHKKHNGHNNHISSPARSSDKRNLDLDSRTQGPERRSKPSRSGKIANLLRALDDALEESSVDEISDVVGREILNRCRDLRSSLRQLSTKEQDMVPINITPPYSQTKSHDLSNLPKTMSPLAITPWTFSSVPSSLPPLPAVLDPTLEAAAFIHSGCGSGKVTDLNYERLEWVGDAYIYLTSTLLISQTFPSLLPGKCSHIRERLLKNIQLAEYSRQYGFEKRAQLPEAVLGGTKHPPKDQEKTKIMGDIFEAYVAAVALSDPIGGVARVSDWLKGLWSMTIAKEIAHQECQGFKLDSPLWRLRGDAEPILQVLPPLRTPLNPKEQLQKELGTKGVKLTYKDASSEKKDKDTKLPIFTVGVYLEGWGEKDKQLGFGRASGKKDAGMKAAEMALANKKMMKLYTEKKRIFEAQMEAEREALEKQGILPENLGK